MAQVKVFGIREHLDPIKARLSEVIHSCVVDSLRLPPEKRFHRFFPLDPADCFYPQGTSARYTVLEISMFEGRAVETRKELIRLLFQRIGEHLGLRPEEVEITITETPKHNWGIRGRPGDEVGLGYRVEV